MVSEVHKPKETEVKERKKIKVSGTTKIKYKNNAATIMF